MSDEENKTYCMSGNLFRTSGGCLQLDDHNCESYALPYDKIIATKEEVEKAFEKHDAAIARQARMGEMKKLAEWLHSPECFGYIGTPKIWDRIVEEVEKRTQTLEGNTGQEKDMVCSICGAIDETHTAYCAKDGRVPHHLVLRQAPSAPKSSDGCGKECYGGLACGDIEAGYLVICPECKKKNERLNTRAIPVRPIMGHFFGHEANPAQAKKEELGHDATCPMTGKPPDTLLPYRHKQGRHSTLFHSHPRIWAQREKIEWDVIELCIDVGRNGGFLQHEGNRIQPLHTSLALHCPPILFFEHSNISYYL